MEEPGNSEIIEIRSLVKAFGLMPVLKKLDLKIQVGQFVALLGPNGSGKSTLLQLICGLAKPTSGEILVGGWRIPDEAHAVRAQLGLVSHKSLLYANLTAGENLRFFGELYNLQRSELNDRIDVLLNQVGLYKRKHSMVRTFSRGMQQRLSVARALLHNPQILLFDEPYTGLDQDAIHILDSLLRDAHEEGRTILMSTHLLEHVSQLAQRAITLSNGKIILDTMIDHSYPNKLLEQYTSALGESAAG